MVSTKVYSTKVYSDFVEPTVTPPLLHCISTEFPHSSLRNQVHGVNNPCHHRFHAFKWLSIHPSYTSSSAIQFLFDIYKEDEMASAE